MGGFIFLDDGRGLAPANWAYDALLEAIVQHLPPTQDGAKLGAWLLDRRCQVRGPGMGSVDVRELTRANRDAIERATRAALVTARARGPVALGWKNADPTAFAGWLDKTDKLVRMFDSIARGEPPESLNELREPKEPTGKKSGPGW